MHCGRSLSSWYASCIIASRKSLQPQSFRNSTFVLHFKRLSAIEQRISYKLLFVSFDTKDAVTSIQPNLFLGRSQRVPRNPGVAFKPTYDMKHINYLFLGAQIFPLELIDDLVRRYQTALSVKSMMWQAVCCLGIISAFQFTI